jgi:hypothetical protein
LPTDLQTDIFETSPEWVDREKERLQMITGGSQAAEPFEIVEAELDKIDMVKKKRKSVKTTQQERAYKSVTARTKRFKNKEGLRLKSLKQ